MKRFSVLLCFLTLISCQDKVICPAYQSTYILDDTTRNAYFSYVWQLDEATRTQYLSQQQSGDTSSTDSLGIITQPKTDYYAYAGEYIVPWGTPKKTKYGIVKPVFYPVKKYRMRTASMENVLAPEPLSNDFVAEDFGIDSLQSDRFNKVASDSLTSDSIVVAKEVKSDPDKEDEVRFLYGYDPSDNFNVEQLYYNKYFGDRLIDNRPKPEPRKSVADSLSSDLKSDSTVVDKEPFFKGLFKKKKKESVPDLEANEPETKSSSDQQPQPAQPEGDGGQI